MDNATAKFDLALELPSVPEARGYVEYNTSLFRPETVDRMAADFQRVLSGLLAQPEVPIDRLSSVQAIKAESRPAALSVG